MWESKRRQGTDPLPHTEAVERLAIPFPLGKGMASQVMLPDSRGSEAKGRVNEGFFLWALQ